MDSGARNEIPRTVADVKARTHGWTLDLFDSAITAELETIALIEGNGGVLDPAKAKKRENRLRAHRSYVQMLAAEEGDVRQSRGTHSIQRRFAQSAIHKRWQTEGHA